MIHEKDQHLKDVPGALPRATKKKRVKKTALQKRKDNPNSGYWKKRADKEWGRVIHLSDICIVNDKCRGSLEAHHFISRSKLSTRHKLLNGVLLCTLHHKFSKELSPHMGPIGFSEYLRINYPDKYQWVLDNRFKNEKPNFKEAYEKLKEIKE